MHTALALAFFRWSSLLLTLNAGGRQYHLENRGERPGSKTFKISEILCERQYTLSAVHVSPPRPPLGFSTGPAMVSGRGLRRPAAAVATSPGLWPGPCPRPWAHDPFEEGGSGRLAWHRRFRAAWGRVGYQGLGVQQHEPHRRTLRWRLARSLRARRQGSGNKLATGDALRARSRKRSSTTNAMDTGLPRCPSIERTTGIPERP